MALGRDLLLPVEEIRRREGGAPVHGEGVATTSLPDLRGGGVRVVFGTIFAERYDPKRDAGYHTPDEAWQQGCQQLGYYHLLHQRGDITLISTQADLERVLTDDAPTPGVVPLMEGADILRSPDDLERFVEMGVRIVGPAWKGTRYAGGTGEPGPLTDLGRELLQEMRRIGVALDVSHLAEDAFWEALDLFDGPVIASHANTRARVPTDRQLSNDMLQALAERDAVIGMVLYNKFIVPTWTAAAGKDSVTLTDLMRHAEQIIGLVGVQHLGLGTDLDGGLGRDDVPREIDTVADLPRIAEALAVIGLSRTEIAAIMSENWLRVLHRILPT